MADETESTLAATTPSADDPARELRSGDTLGRYVVLARLGAGGMGVVYQAYDPKLDRKVAIKLLRRGPGRGSAHGHTRLVREAQAMARLADPNVVAVHDVGELGDQPYIAMEFVQGETVTAWLARQRREWREILSVFLAAGRGLVAAHDAGLVHRDFKPDNVMIDAQGRVRVMDFGLARSDVVDEAPLDPSSGRTGGLSTPMTMTGLVVGTPAYSSPEQLNLQSVDERSDQFSFCVALWEALYGRRPFAAPTVPETVARLMDGRVDPPPRDAGVPTWLRRVLERGLSIDPRQRWPRMGDLLAALERGLQRRQRRRVIAALGVGVVSVIAWRSAVALDDHRRRTACATDSEAVWSTWNDGVRSTLGAALGRDASEWSATTFDRASVNLERWSESWHAAYAEGCAAALADDPATSGWTASRACLEQSRGELEVLFGAFTDGAADQDGVQRFARVVADLDAPGQCNDPRWLEDHPPLGADDDPLQLRKRLWQASALEEAGRTEAALELALAVAGDAERVGDVPARIEALTAVGHAQVNLGRADDARARLVEAFDMALAAGEDRRAILVAALLVSVVGHDMLRDEEAQWWARIGRDLLARRGAESSISAARLHRNVGVLHMKFSRESDAERELNSALEIEQTLLGEQHPAIATSLDSLANAYRAHGRYDDALATHRRALEIREATLGPDHVDVANSANNLGGDYDQLGRYDEAEQSFARALQIRERVYGPTHRRVGSVLTNLGLLAMRRGRHGEAEAHMRRALAIYASGTPDRDQLAKVHAILAQVHRATGRRREAIAELRQALEILESLFGPSHPQAASTLNNLASVHGELGELDEAERLYRQALAILEQRDETADLGSTLANLAGLHAQRRHFELAEREFRRAIDILERKLGREAHAVTFAWAGFIELLLERGRASEAVELADRTLAVRERNRVDPLLVAEAQFLVARARAAAGHDRDAAVALARRAQATLASPAGDGYPDMRERVDAWLAAQ